MENYDISNIQHWLEGDKEPCCQMIRSHPCWGINQMVITDVNPCVFMLQLGPVITHHNIDSPQWTKTETPNLQKQE